VLDYLSELLAWTWKLALLSLPFTPLVASYLVGFYQRPFRRGWNGCATSAWFITPFRICKLSNLVKIHQLGKYYFYIFPQNSVLILFFHKSDEFWYYIFFLFYFRCSCADKNSRFDACVNGSEIIPPDAILAASGGTGVPLWANTVLMLAFLFVFRILGYMVLRYFRRPR